MPRIKDWFKIDNAGKVYTAISSEKNPNVFRIAVRLAEAIDGEILQRAVNEIMPRFPLFKTKVRAGIFWEYLDRNTKEVRAYPMNKDYCRFIDPNETNLYLFRVSYFADKIALEVLHVLSDGAGSLVFLQSLIYRYLTLMGKSLKIDGAIKTIDQPPTLEEVEDSYLAYYDKHNNKAVTAGRAYHVTGTALPRGINVTDVRLPVGEMLALARSHGATVTEYLTALLTYSIYKAQLEGRGRAKTRLPVKICIPYNLRKIYKSQSLKNFSTYIKAEYLFDKPADFTAVLDSFKTQIKEENDPARLTGRFSSTTKIEKNFFTKIVPLFIKKPVMKLCYKYMGDNVITTSFSNLGVVKFADSIEEYITGCEVNLFTSGCFSLLACACTYKDVLQISFNRNIVECDVEQYFIRHLAENGLAVTVSVNR